MFLSPQSSDKAAFAARSNSHSECTSEAQSLFLQGEVAKVNTLVNEFHTFLNERSEPFGFNAQGIRPGTEFLEPKFAEVIAYSFPDRSIGKGQRQLRDPKLHRL